MPGANCIDYGYMAVDSTSKSLSQASTGGVPPGAKGLILSVESAGVRMRLDGTAATTDIGGGDVLNVGDVFVLDSWAVPKQNWRSVLLGARVIAKAGDGSTANLNLHYFD